MRSEFMAFVDLFSYDLASQTISVYNYRGKPFLKYKIGEVFEGVVSYVGEHGFFVKLENTIEGFVGYESPVDYKIGQKVKIILSSVDRVSAKIDFVLYKKKYDRTYKEFY